MTPRELEIAIKQITDRLGEVNRLTIKKIAAQLLKIGELNATSINRIVVMAEMGVNIAEITRALSDATAMNVRDLYVIYQQALTDTYTDTRFRDVLEERPLTDAQKARITMLAQNISTQTAQAMVNLSNTTAIAAPYRAAVDKAILAVSAGHESYTEATREIIQEMGRNGLQVQYESGYHRRLDSAVRQNVIDGVNQINQKAALAMGEMLGYDAVEISAHLNSAPDHEPVQGRVFLLREYEKMQAGQDFYDVDGKHYEGFRRPIGEWNCMHIATAFDTRFSTRRYSDEQLEKWRKDNATGCEIGGKHYSMYEARQLMREIETQVRREKDAANAARLNGNDMDTRRDCQKRINALAKKYYAVCQASGLSPQSERMSVEGFRMVKV